MSENTELTNTQKAKIMADMAGLDLSLLNYRESVHSFMFGNPGWFLGDEYFDPFTDMNHLVMVIGGLKLSGSWGMEYKIRNPFTANTRTMKVEITKAQLNAIVHLRDDISSMIGCAGDPKHDQLWSKHVRLIDNMLNKNGLKSKHK